jgi:hypothetical protein
MACHASSFPLKKEQMFGGSSFTLFGNALDVWNRAETGLPRIQPASYNATAGP